jgi:hypothetical protein
MPFDRKCWDLASSFLGDHPHLETVDRIDALARHIQTQIDNWIASANENYEPRDPLAHVEFPFAENH